MKKYAIVFPGQGSQKIGMGSDLINNTPLAKERFEIAATILGRNLLDICQNGPAEELTKTENAQPGIFVISSILYSLLKENGIQAQVVAGHSLGELTAYFAANSTTFEDTLKIIKERGLAMANAYPSELSAMTAVMGLSLETIETTIAPFSDIPVVAANINCPGQIVISGKKEGIEKASIALKEAGAKLIPLNVSGAFHSPLMKSASETLKTKIESIEFKTSDTPIVLNRTAENESDSSKLKENIPIQVISPVRWIETIQKIEPTVDAFIECGPGKVLTGLIRKIAPNATIHTINDKESLDAFLRISKGE